MPLASAMKSRAADCSELPQPAPMLKACAMVAARRALATEGLAKSCRARLVRSRRGMAQEPARAKPWRPRGGAQEGRTKPAGTVEVRDVFSLRFAFFFMFLEYILFTTYLYHSADNIIFAPVLHLQGRS